MCDANKIDDPIQHAITCKGINGDEQLPPAHNEDEHDTATAKSSTYEQAGWEVHRRRSNVDLIREAAAYDFESHCDKHEGTIRLLDWLRQNKVVRTEAEKLRKILSEHYDINLPFLRTAKEQFTSVAHPIDVPVVHHTYNVADTGKHLVSPHVGDWSSTMEIHFCVYRNW